jgi:pectate lyase
MSTGVLMSSLIVVLALVGVAAVKYRQSQEDNSHTNSGYWRAPSIQAMLFDDSAHAYSDESPLNGSSGGAGGVVVMSRVVEMEDLKSGAQPPTVEAIQVTVSPITHSDEIRV